VTGRFVRGRRLRLVALAGAAAAFLAACTSANGSGPSPTSTPTATAPSPSSVPWTGTSSDPLAPATGALVGAWVRPQPYTQDGRIDSVARFEHQIGGPLDIVHTYRRWTEPFFSPSDLQFISTGHLLQLSWAGDDARKIASGAFDNLIRARARAARAMGRPFFMEWRWEMDRPNLQATVWSGPDYVKAWQHIHAIFDQEGATNASWVWCPTADGFAKGRAQSYYPGDAWVDWVCVDAYPGSDLTPMSDVLAPFLSWAAGHDKPIMIGEYGVPRSASPAERAAWLTATAATFRAHPQIKAVVYYDENPGGHSAKRAYVIDDQPPVLEAFRAMARSPYFDPHRKR
jgi:hypothetical protein